MVQDWWLEEKVEGWRYLVDIMAGVARKHLQTVYVGLHESLQQEWDFVQLVTPYIGTTFQPMKDALQDPFLPALLKGDISQIPGR